MKRNRLLRKADSAATGVGVQVPDTNPGLPTLPENLRLADECAFRGVVTTTRGIANFLTMSERTARDHALAGRIPSVLLGRRRLFILGDVLAALRRLSK